MLLEVDFDRFWAFFNDFLLRLGSKNMQKPSKKRLYVLFAYKIYISQQAENRVNTSTSVFARRWLKYTANTMHFTTKGKLFRKPSKIAKTQPMWCFLGADKNATKRCVVRWSQAAVWKEHHIVLCTRARARRAHEQHQRSHYYYTYPLWHRRSAKLYNCLAFLISKTHWPCHVDWRR